MKKCLFGILVLVGIVTATHLKTEPSKDELVVETTTHPIFGKKVEHTVGSSHHKGGIFGTEENVELKGYERGGLSGGKHRRGEEEYDIYPGSSFHHKKEKHHKKDKHHKKHHKKDEYLEDVSDVEEESGILNPHLKEKFTKGVRPILGKEHIIGGNIIKGSEVPSGVSTYKVNIDEDVIEDIVEDFSDFGDRYLKETRTERIALMKKLTEVFRNTAAKMILNFGKTIPPVVHSWVELMRNIQVNPKCDQNCAVKCLDPMEGVENLFFDQRCLLSCQCKFNIEEVNPNILRAKMDNITRNYQNLNRFFTNLNKENMLKLRPAFENYLSKASELHEEFGELLKEHSAKILGCDEQCIDDCLDVDFVSFWEIPMCVSNCKCKHGLISINKEGGWRGSLGYNFEDVLLEGEEEIEEELFPSRFASEHKYRGVKGTRGKDFNLPELMKYSDYDRSAWSFFKRYQEDI